MAPFASAGEITVAAASDLQFALRDIAHDYEAKTGNTVKLTFGSSGALAAQIRNGAPFDVFFSADASYPDALVQAKAAEGSTLVRYARGVLVMWLANGVPIPDIVGPGGSIAALVSFPEVHRVAIANPQHAPYGRAAVEALKAAGLYDRVSPKLIIGENVSQAAQFAQSGNVQAALIPLSLALAPGLRDAGHYSRVDATYAPIIQAAVVTVQARDRALARDFLKYVTTSGTPILKRYGFEPANAPAPSPGGRK